MFFISWLVWWVTACRSAPAPVPWRAEQQQCGAHLCVTGGTVPAELRAQLQHLRGLNLPRSSSLLSNNIQSRSGRTGRWSHCFLRQLCKSRAKQFGGGGTANEHKWCVVTQQGPVDKERRVQPGSEKEERRCWGPANTRLSSVNVKPTPPLLLLRTCNLLGKRHNIIQTDYCIEKLLQTASGIG